MYNLPSVQKRKTEKAKAIFLREKSLVIYEPCNCGSQIRHNNGGNYHEIIYLVIDDGKYFIMSDSTSDFAPTPEWEELKGVEKEALSIIEEHADWL